MLWLQDQLPPDAASDSILCAYWSLTRVALQLLVKPLGRFALMIVPHSSTYAHTCTHVHTQIHHQPDAFVSTPTSPAFDDLWHTPELSPRSACVQQIRAVHQPQYAGSSPQTLLWLCITCGGWGVARQTGRDVPIPSWQVHLQHGSRCTTPLFCCWLAACALTPGSSPRLLLGQGSTQIGPSRRGRLPALWPQPASSDGSRRTVSQT